jgi:hypothetical protein
MLAGIDAPFTATVEDMLFKKERSRLEKHNFPKKIERAFFQRLTYLNF